MTELEVRDRGAKARSDLAQHDEVCQMPMIVLQDDAEALTSLVRRSPVAQSPGT